MVKSKDRYIMAVMPASWRIDFNKLKDVLHEKDLSGLQLKRSLNQFSLIARQGSNLPFGNLYNIDTYVDKSLAKDDHIFLMPVIIMRQS